VAAARGPALPNGVRGIRRHAPGAASYNDGPGTPRIMPRIEGPVGGSS
jgi:hypothetical protein